MLENDCNCCKIQCEFCIEDISIISNLHWEIGSHIGFSQKLAPTIKKCIDNGMYSVQFFMGNPKSAWSRQVLSIDDINNCKQILQRFPVNVFSHYPYCANLAGQSSIGGLAWNGNSVVDNKLKGAMNMIEYELSILANFSSYGRSGVVIHPGSYPDRDAGHKAVAETINRISFPENSVLLLENCAGEGNKLCRNFEELRVVMSNINSMKKKYVKVCVDTAHIFASGYIDLRKKEEVTRLFREFDHHLGLENFHLLHLNDSETSFGSKKDLHANLGEGQIWNKSFDSLIYLLDECKKYKIPMVLETCDPLNDILKLVNMR